MATTNEKERMIKESETIKLSSIDQKRFTEVLLTPPAPSEALKHAFAQREKLINSQ